MITFKPIDIDEDIVLANANILLDFDPTDEHKNNTLFIGQDGLLVLQNRHLNDASAEQVAPDKRIKELGFLQESLVLLWQAHHFWALMNKRFNELKDAPINDIHQYHQAIMNLNGFYHLCKNFRLQLENFKNHIDAYHQDKGFRQDLFFALTDQFITKSWADHTLNAKTLLKSIKAYKTELINYKEAILTIPLFGQVALGHVSAHSFEFGRYNFGGALHKFKVSLEFVENFTDVIKKNPFSAKLKMELACDTDESVHGSMSLYPSWDAVSMRPITLDEFNDANDGSNEKLIEGYEQSGTGMIALFKEPTLKACFSHICPHMFTHSFVPYFMGLVSAAKQQGFAELTFYAPYGFSAIALAAGFSSQDEERPTLVEQLNTINDAMQAGTLIQPQVEFDKQAPNGDQLCRAFHLKVGQLDKKKVFITNEKKETTYSKLFEDNALIDAKTYPQGIVPEFNQAPLQFSPLSKKASLPERLAQRERGERFRIPAVSLSLQQVNYELINSKTELSAYAFADPEVAKQNGFRKQLTLRRF